MPSPSKLPEGHTVSRFRGMDTARRDVPENLASSRQMCGESKDCHGAFPGGNAGDRMSEAGLYQLGALSEFNEIVLLNKFGNSTVEYTQRNI